MLIVSGISCRLITTELFRTARISKYERNEIRASCLRVKTNLLFITVVKQDKHVIFKKRKLPAKFIRKHNVR